MTHIPQLKVVGTCSVCGQAVEVEPESFCDAASEHKVKGQCCRGSDYSCTETWFVMETAEEALAVATFLKDDTDKCLDRPSAGHSRSCSDGRHCSETRRKVAAAFANYYLRNGTGVATTAAA